MTYVYYDNDLVFIGDNLEKANDFVDTMVLLYDRQRYDYDIQCPIEKVLRK